MITNEQVRAYKDTYNDLAGYCDTDSVREALEAYEQSKWVKFDADNELTHPRDNQMCAVVYHTGRVSTDKWSNLHMFWVYASCQKCVTHWQYLPEFKES